MKSHECNAQSKADYTIICLRLCRFLYHFIGLKLPEFLQELVLSNLLHYVFKACFLVNNINKVARSPPSFYNITHQFLARLGIYNELCATLLNDTTDEDICRRHELYAAQ